MRKKKRDDPMDAYRRVRKPVPPPTRQIPDRRRKIRDETARKEAEEDRGK